MKKINVIGTTGSGKSMLSKRLADKLKCKHIEMDQLVWMPNWQETPNSEFLAKVDEATASDAWVLDGNFTRTSEIKWQRVDTIVWLDYSYTRTFFQLLKRSILRMLSGDELWEGTGNKESFVKTFLSKDSILLWFFKTYGKKRKQYLALMESSSIEHIKFIRLRNPKDVEHFLERVAP